MTAADTSEEEVCKNSGKMDNKPHDHIWCCPYCGQRFSLQDFLDCPELRPRGMTHDDESEVIVLYFDHDTPDCGTTFAVPSDSLRECIDELIPPNSLHGTAECGEHCNDVSDL